jgi:signal transduction histidine kinase
MGAIRIGRLEAVGPWLGKARQSRIHDISRKGTAGIVATTQLWVLCALCLLVIGVGQVHTLAFRAPTLRASIETEITLCALVAACLFGLSFGHRRQLLDLVLVAALLQLATIDLVSYVLPAAIGLRSPGLLNAAPMFGAPFTAGILALGAWASPECRVRAGRRPVALAISAGLFAAAASEAGGMVLGAQPMDPSVGMALSITAAAVLVVAAARISGSDRAAGGSVSLLLAAAMIAFAAGSLNYLVSPTTGLGWVSAREGLRLVGYGLILAAALRQEWAIRRAIGGAAAAEERRRIARDLHDGLAQDLAFIAAHGDRIARETGEDHPIAIAARRALAVSRGAIADLSASDAASAKAALRQVADELEIRFGVRVSVEADDVELSCDVREDVVRIAREAIVNAARAGARNIVLSLARDGARFVLRVSDDGAGIRSGELNGRPGFGLNAMRERTTALGGALTARPAPGGGTELEVMFP